VVIHAVIAATFGSSHVTALVLGRAGWVCSSVIGSDELGETMVNQRTARLIHQKPTETSAAEERRNMTKRSKK
jgi:hypothetical protein